MNEVTTTKYGFRWGDVLVERTASNDKNPKFQVIRVFTPSGDCVEICSRPKSTKVNVYPNPELTWDGEGARRQIRRLSDE